MDLKEYIKSLIHKQLEEESISGDAGGYLTPKAFSPKGQKTNAATKQAERSGWKKAPGMPKKSKVLDYKELWKGKKSAMNENNKIEELAKEVKIALKKLNRESNYLYEKPASKWDEYDISNAKSILNKFKKLNKKDLGESNYDAASKYGAASGYSAPSGYTGGSIKGDDYYKRGETASAAPTTTNEMKLNDIIDQELLNEVTYHKFKNEVKFRTKSEQLHKAIREVKRKLAEIDRIVEYTSRMKQELSEGEEGIKYWKATQKNVGQISEMVNQLNNKIKNLNQ